MKLFIDGSLGAGTAFLRSPYRDREGSGIPTMTRSDISDMVNTAECHSCQVVAHCIGDGAVELMLDIYDSVISENRNRHGILHCQLTDRALLERMKNRDILVFVQPVFIDYDMDIVSTRVGERLASESYAFGDMVCMGIRTSYGTDAPVEDMNPFENI
ncbi:MAG: amidohydrolase family protein, partial [Clostridiales bacterium]|nr:amidohydrolase family protein [Clostridiales bacterium]